MERRKGYDPSPGSSAFVILLLMATPVSIAMGLAAVIAILVTGKVPLNTVVTQMVAGMDSFPLDGYPFLHPGRRVDGAGGDLGTAGDLGQGHGGRISRVDWGWS